MKTIKELLNWGVAEIQEVSTTPLLDSQIILENIINCDKIFLIINKDNVLKADDIESFREFIFLRKSGIPVQYIVKEQEFMGINFYVDESVLIPRADTEILVEKSINLLKEFRFPKVLEIGVGSGAISVALAKFVENSNIVAVDISKSALEIAIKNAKSNDVYGKIKFLNGDLFSNISDEYLENFDIIVSNPPYIPKGDICGLQLEVRNEPVLALDGGLDGLDFYRRIVRDGAKYISNGGYLAFEVGHDQSNEVKEIMEEFRYKNVEIFKDLQGIERVVVGKKSNL